VYLTRYVLNPGGVEIQECLACRGVLLSPFAWTELLDLLGANEPVAVGHFVPLPPNAQRPSLLALVPCPVCRSEMDRVVFAARSNVVMDVCAMHGVWLDAGEVAPLVAFYRRILSGELQAEAEADLRGIDQLEAELAMGEAEFERLFRNYEISPDPAGLSVLRAKMQKIRDLKVACLRFPPKPIVVQTSS
jgi:Zn-finger nucleic acid-binding protein